MKSLLIAGLLMLVPSMVFAGTCRSGHCNQNLRQRVIVREHVVVPYNVVEVQKVVVDNHAQQVQRVQKSRRNVRVNQNVRRGLFGRSRNFSLNIQRNVN